MRTATTIAKTHTGEWRLLNSPVVPIHEQKKEWNGLRSSRTNPDFSEVHFQESDGLQCVARFTKPIENSEQTNITKKKK